MLFSTHNTKVIPPRLQINGKSLEYVQNFDFLGITIDRHLKWVSHTDKIAKKITKVIGVMNKLKKNSAFSRFENII